MAVMPVHLCNYLANTCQLNLLKISKIIIMLEFFILSVKLIRVRDLIVTSFALIS